MPDTYVRHERGLRSLATLLHDGVITPPVVHHGAFPPGARHVFYDKFTWFFDRALDCEDVWVTSEDFAKYGEQLVDIVDTVRIMGGFYPRKHRNIYVLPPKAARSEPAVSTSNFPITDLVACPITDLTACPITDLTACPITDLATAHSPTSPPAHSPTSTPAQSPTSLPAQSATSPHA
jgi:hypothetical protein